MKVALAMCGAFVVAIGGSCISSAVAQQNPPPGSVMLVPGVYTTPEISAKCQAYAAKRVVGGSNTDSSRQAVALACAKKLMAKQNKKRAAISPALITRPAVLLAARP